MSAGVAHVVSGTNTEECLFPLNGQMIRMERGDQAIAHRALTAPRGASKWLSFLPGAIAALKCVSAVCLALSPVSQADDSFGAKSFKKKKKKSFVIH